MGLTAVSYQAPDAWPGHPLHDETCAFLAEITRNPEEVDETTLQAARDILWARSTEAARMHAEFLIYYDATYDLILPATSATEEDQSLPVLYRDHFSNLVGECRQDFGKYRGRPATGARLWVSRMTVADGARCDNQRELELLLEGSWVLVLPDPESN